MRKLQLYINNTRVDLFKDETVSINASIQDIKDPAKIFTEFTKAFTIPASKTNNKLFKHYYNWNVVNADNNLNSAFDARDKVASVIEINSIPFKKGFVALTGVELKFNKPYAYKIVFYGETVDLKNTLGDDKLGQLSKLGTYSVNYDVATIQARLQTAAHSGAILCPLITSGASNDGNDLRPSRLFYNSQTTTNGTGNLYWQGGGGHDWGVLYSDLKYAIRVHEIIDAIQDQYSNIVFSDDFFSTSNAEFYSLYLWLQRKKGSVEPASQITEFPSPVTGFGIPGPSNKTGMLNSNTLEIFGTDLPTITQNLIINTSSSDPYTVVVYQGTTPFATFSNQTGDKVYGKSELGTLTAGNYSITIFSATQIVFTDTTPIGIKWELSGYNQGGGSGWSENWIIESFTASATFTFDPQEQIPDIKTIDFLTSIFQMFNLTAYFDDRPLLANGNNNPNYRKIRVQKLESFYLNNVNEYDITEFIKIDSKQVNIALPYNEINFSYTGNDTLLAKQYEQLNGKPWGAEEYIGDGDQFNAPNNKYSISIDQEHLMYERLIDVNNTLAFPNNQTSVQWGYMVDDNQDAILGKPLFFYPIHQPNVSATDSISFRNGTTAVEVNNYFIPSNSLSLDPSVSTINLNFREEFNEYTTETGFIDTLFQTNYSTYISDIFNGKRRLVKMKALLPINIILQFNLNDTFIVGAEKFKINTIQINLITGDTDLELLNIISEPYLILTNVSFQNISRDVYYNSSIGSASNLANGDVIFSDTNLNIPLGAGTYTQPGSSDSTTHCNSSNAMSMTLNSSGAITSISCAQP